MTYFEFHLLFNIPLLALLLWSGRRRMTRTHWKWLAVVAAIATAFTFPWDNWAVGRGIWSFPDDRVTARIGNLPIEEILFFIFESMAVCLLALRFLPRSPIGTGKK